MASTTVVPVREPNLLEKMAKEYSLEPAKFWEGVKATIAPTKSGGALASDAEIMAYLMTAHHYHLNPFLREIHGFVGKGGKVQAIVGIDGWIKIANRNPKYCGFEMVHKLDSKEALISITCKIKVRDDSIAAGFRTVEMTEYMSECKMPGKEPWEKWPARMLHHKAFIQAARYAFGITEFIDEDEAERYDREIDVTPGKSAFSPPQQKREESAGTMAEERRPAEHAAAPAEPQKNAAPATTEPTKPTSDEGTPGDVSDKQLGKIAVCYKELGIDANDTRHKDAREVLKIESLPKVKGEDGVLRESFKGLGKEQASALIESLVKRCAAAGQKK